MLFCSFLHALFFFLILCFFKILKTCYFWAKIFPKLDVNYSFNIHSFSWQMEREREKYYTAKRHIHKTEH